MKKLVILALAVAFSTALHAQTPTPSPAPLSYAQAVAAKKALINPSYAAVLAADNAILAAPDITQAQSGIALADKAVWVERTGGSPADVIATYLAAYQAGNTSAFKPYLTHAYAAGDPARSTALAALPTYLNAVGSTYESLATQATAQELQGQLASALQSWQAAANTITSYTSPRAVAIINIARLSKAIGNSPATTNGIVIPLLTAYNVPVADAYFQNGYAAVNRSALATADLKVFLTKILSIVNVTDVNAKFLGMVQSQLAAVSANN